MAPAPQSDPAAKVAFVSGAAASAGVLAGLHARLLLIPPYKTAVALLRRLGFSGRSVVIAVPYLWLLARSEEHTSELQSLMRISYAVFCLKKKTTKSNKQYTV